jgi:hypothetical protein
MFVVILDNGVYQSAGNHPNIFESFMSKKGFIYNLGCLVHDFTFHFNDKYFVEVQSWFMILHFISMISIL